MTLNYRRHGPKNSAIRKPAAKFWNSSRHECTAPLTYRHELPVETVLAGGLATLPLARASDVGLEDLPRVLRTLLERLYKEAPPHQEAMLWASTEVLLSLR